jgi:hypothetical protein
MGNPIRQTALLTDVSETAPVRFNATEVQMQKIKSHRPTVINVEVLAGTVLKRSNAAEDTQGRARTSGRDRSGKRAASA